MILGMEQTTKRHALGERLRMLRTMRGMTQRDLAARLGCHKSLVCLRETGRVGMTLDAVEASARALGVEVVDLLVRPRRRGKGRR
jgi:transcriptional regulator with XRE-family HTH domain